MKNRFRYSGIMSLFVLVCFGFRLCPAAEPNEQEIQLAKEKMERLREVYKEVQQAEAELQQVIDEAERKEPLLREMKEAFTKIIEFKEHGLTKERAMYRRYLKNSEDPNAIKKLFLECRSAFGAKESAEAFRDPNQARLLKKPMIAYFRGYARDQSAGSRFMRRLSENPSFTVFDVNDPNEERLWQNIKRFTFELAEHYKAERQKLIEQKGVPEWLADYAGKRQFAGGTFEMYYLGVYLLTPQEVRDAEERVNELYRKMGRIYPRWNQMRHLLAGEKNPDNEAVIRAVQEHMQIWPTVHRTVYRK